MTLGVVEVAELGRSLVQARVGSYRPRSAHIPIVSIVVVGFDIEVDVGIEGFDGTVGGN